jgi:YD repeat-containing protein
MVGAAKAMAATAVIGPDGPYWLGPFPPGTVADLRLVVDPVTGALDLRHRDAPGVWRSWDGKAWSVDGADGEPEGVRFKVVGGKLVEVERAGGGLWRYRYDEQDRLIELVAVGELPISLRYDAQGRVAEVNGPGRSRWRLNWTQGLTAVDALGRETRVQPQPGRDHTSTALRVEDSQGRAAVSTYAPGADGQLELQSWTNPRGLETRLRRLPGRIIVEDPANRQWQVEVDGGGRIGAVVEPGGGRWTWERDGEGRVVRAGDPMGRTWRWDRDGAGRIVRLSLGGRPTVLVRDASGAVIRIVDALGNGTDLERDARGRLYGVVDNNGNRLILKRGPVGEVVEVTERTGGIWSFGFDLRRRVDRAVDSTGRMLQFTRDSFGLVRSVAEQGGSGLRIDRDVAGRISRVVDADGRVSGLLRDGLGRVASIVLPDGTSVTLRRDAAGDVVAIGGESGDTLVRRDAAGLVQSVGEVSWLRSASGRVVEVSTPALRLRLRRDPSGALVGLIAGRWTLDLTRDESGSPRSWEGSDGKRQVERDAAGRITALTGATRMVIRRDARGMVSAATSERGEWRMSRDAAGRVLKATGPGLLSLGVDRDLAGRAILVRQADGLLTRRTWAGALLTEEVVDANGRRLWLRQSERDVAGRVLWTETADVGRRSSRYGPLGQLVALEVDDGRAWSWTPGLVQGADGEVLVMDEHGRLAEARPPAGVPAWGVASSYLTVRRDRAGRIERVEGDHGVARLIWDELSRLQQVDAGALGSWVLRYDPSGAVVGIDEGGGESTSVLWGPDLLDRGTVTYASGLGLAVAWLAGPDGPSSMQTGDVLGSLLHDVDGVIRGFHLAGELQPVGTTPHGWLGAEVGVAASGGGTRLFAGGPVIQAGVAIDPISGQRVDGWLGWPWAGPSPLVAAPDRDELDASVWAPESPWSKPVSLLVAVGVLPDIDDESWAVSMPLEAGDRAVPWLPLGLEGGAPPLGPAPGALPFDEDPIANRVLQALLPMGTALEPHDLQHAIIGPDLRLPWLPPGLVLPGLEPWGVESVAPGDGT